MINHSLINAAPMKMIHWTFWSAMENKELKIALKYLIITEIYLIKSGKASKSDVTALVSMEPV